MDARHIACGVRENVRADGRACTSRRGTLGADGGARGAAAAFDVKLGVLEECYGSARATGARGENDVLVGVKLDLVKPGVDGGGASHGDVVVKVTGPGLARTTVEAARLEDFFRSILVGAGGCGLDTSSLSILGAKLAWRVLVDVIVVACDGCGVVDCAGVAIKCALASTRLPRLSVSRDAAAEGPSGRATESVMTEAFGASEAAGGAAAGASLEFEVESGDDDGGGGDGAGDPIDVGDVPVAVCVAKMADGLVDGDRARDGDGDGDGEDAYGVGGFYYYMSSSREGMRRSDYVIDPTLEEELCSDMLLLVGVRRPRGGGEGAACCVRSVRGGLAGGGGGVVLGSALHDMMSMATRSGSALADAVDSFLEDKR